MGTDHENSTAADAPAHEREQLQQLERLRSLLARPERERIERIEERLALPVEAASVAEVLPDAVALRGERDDRLARALGPAVARGLEEQITRNPKRVADAIYPVLGPAIRRAIADALAGMAESLNRAIEYSLSWRGLRWRVESWRTGMPFAQVVLRHALVYRVEQALLVHTTTGLPLEHVAVTPDRERDSDLVSGMLTAIRDFVGDSFEPEQGGELRGATVGDVTLHVETGPRAMLAVAVRGQAPSQLRERWQTVLETIHLRFAAQLAAFDGDAAPFEPARPLLEECLETVLQTDRPEGRSVAPRLVWATLVILLLGAGALALRNQLRFRSLVHEIDLLPGVAVVEASRGPLHTQVRGLRDPASRDPDALLRERGVSPRRLRTRWESYLSNEPEMVIVRARELLRPPDSVGLQIETGGTGRGVLRVTGEAPRVWLDAASRASVPGVLTIDLGGVEAGLPAELRAALDALASKRVLFEVGSAELDAAARREVDAVASVLADLERLAAAAGYRARLELVGRTDEAGTASVNRELSSARAAAVHEALRAAGAGASSGMGVVVRGVGTDDPIASGLDASPRVNRSVSFAASLQLERPPVPPSPPS